MKIGIKLLEEYSMTMQLTKGKEQRVIACQHS